MKHEGFDFTKNVWDEKDPKSDEKMFGNIAVPHLLLMIKTLKKIWVVIFQSSMRN